MPIAKRKAIARKNVRIPEPLIDEVDRIVQENGLYINRQQFIEAAIRDRLEQNRSGEKADAAFEADIKHRLLVHVVVNAARDRAVPADHSELKRRERYIRQCVEERAAREGKLLTKAQQDALVADLSEYCTGMLNGFNAEANRKCR